MGLARWIFWNGLGPHQAFWADSTPWAYPRGIPLLVAPESFEVSLLLPTPPLIEGVPAGEQTVHATESLAGGLDGLLKFPKNLLVSQ